MFTKPHNMTETDTNAEVAGGGAATERNGGWKRQR